MANTSKRVTINLSKDDATILEKLMEEMQENQSQLIKKALYFYYLNHKNK